MPRPQGSPKNQHYVPRAYLARWALQGKVFVRWRNGKTFEANPKNVAAETGMYDIEGASPVPSGGLDEALTTIDDQGLLAIREVDDTGKPPKPGSDTRAILAAFIAVQLSRTPEQRERATYPDRVRAYAGGRSITKDLVARFLEEEHLRAKPSEQEVEGAYIFATAGESGAVGSAEAFHLMFLALPEMIAALDEMTWRIEVDRKRRLITSDAPVILWAKPSKQDALRGIGVRTAEEIRFPLDPGKQLVLSRRGSATSSRVSGQRARECAIDAANACYRFVIGSPAHRAAISQIRLSPYRPPLRFNVGSAVRVNPDGSREEMGDILHVWVPGR
ncbi:MAG TPA: DUF4238 domain-containing protein [Acidimicrobiia bacterium]